MYRGSGICLSAFGEGAVFALNKRWPLTAVLGNGFCFTYKKQTSLSGWIEFATSNCTCLQPPPVRAGVMLALRICFIWVLLCRCSGNSKSYTFIKGSRDVLFYSLDSHQREILRFLSTTVFAVSRKFALALQRASLFGLKRMTFLFYHRNQHLFFLTLENKDQNLQEHLMSIF